MFRRMNPPLRAAIMAESADGHLSGSERLLLRIADAFSWVWLALICVIAVAVILRYVFGIGRIEFEELQWHLYAAGFLMGIVACTVRDRHVRVDVLRENMRPRTRDWVDFYGILLLQIPFLVLVFWSALPFVADSFAVGERSASAGGLPFRWILKSMLPITFGLLFVTTAAKLTQVVRRLFSEPLESAKSSTGPDL
jgi:TRAP-type mannitol/chloroaromatic compound transport system permease small subunit